MNNSRSSTAQPETQHRKKAVWPLIVLALAVVAAAGYGIYMKAFVGWLTTDVAIESVTVTEGAIEVTGELNGWAAVKDVQCTTDEDTVTVYVTAVWPVLHKDSRFAITMDGEYSEIIEIDVSDDRNALVIWSAD